MSDTTNTATTVIEEIAKQLGMAVDKAGEFVTAMLPQYAGLQVVNSSIKMAAYLIVIVITAVLLNKFLKWHKTHKFVGYDNNEEEFVSRIVVTLIAVVFFVFAGTEFIRELSNAITWGMFPCGKLIDMCLANIK